MSCIVNLCTFCCRDNRSASDVEAGKVNFETRKNEVLNRFLKLTQRYFGSCFQSIRSGIHGRDGDQIVLEACSDCFCEVETFCKLYHEWKCLEIELEWRLRKLSSVIEGADKVARFGSGINTEQVQFLRNFRNEFQQKCTQRCSMSFPRVILENLMHPTKCEVRKVVELKPQVLLETRTTTQFSQMFLGWISTFTAVLLLGNLFLERNATTNDFIDYKQIPISSLDSVISDENSDDDDDDDDKLELHLADQLSPKPKLETSLKNSSRVFGTASTPKPVKAQPRQKRHLPPITCLLPHKIHRSAPDSNTPCAPFRCFRCGRSSNSYSKLLRHRRAFTHCLTTRKLKQKIPLLKMKILQKSDSDDHQINVGVLRPLRIKRNVFSSTDDPDRISDESESGDTTDYDDDSEFAHTNDTSTSSFTSSSDNDEPEFTCSNCAKTFSTASSRTRHEKMCNCNPTSRTLSTTSELGDISSSADSLKEEKKYHCDLISCKHSFVTEPELNAHKRLHGSFACKNCSVVEDFAPALAVHELTHQLQEKGRNSKEYDVNERHFCPRCIVQTRSQKKYVSHFLWAHLKLASGTDLCSVCKVPFLTTASKNAHFLRQHDTKGVDPKFIRKCEQCPAYFLKSKQLRSHLNIMHDCSDEMSTDDEEQARQSSNPNKCVKCGNVFQQESTFQKHKKSCKKDITKVGMKKFICDHKSCKRRFAFEKELEHHKKYHGNFPCQFCNVVKTYAPNLAIHERVHAGKKDKSKGVQEFYCARCNFKCKHKLRYYIRHYLETHLGLPGKRVMCPVCKILFSSNSYSGHYKTFHNTKGVDSAAIRNCGQCPAYFLKDSQLSAHIKQTHASRHDDKNRWQCRHPLVHNANASAQHNNACNNANVNQNQVCRQTFKTEQDLKNHRKLHGEFPCSVCPVVKTYAPELALHEATHFSISFLATSPMPLKRRLGESFKCSRCPSTVKGKFNYVTHFLEKHLNLAPEAVTCQNCEEKFSLRWRSDLPRHIAMKHDTKGMREQDICRCDQCPAFFCKPIFLFHHKRRKHFNEIIHECVDCGRTYSGGAALRTHRLSIHKMKEADFPISCDIPGCERRFEREIDFGWHKHNIHEYNSAATSLVCHECGKKCTTKAALTRHIQGLHSTIKITSKKDPKRYVCEECGKVFQCQVVLDTHKLSHSGPASWKYDCLFCEKMCATKEKLMDHIRIHTNEKPYGCEYCGEEYAHGHNLRNHKNSKHNANDYPKKRKVVNGYVSKKGQKISPRKKLLHK